MVNARAQADQISKLEEEFKAIFEQLKATSDPSERSLLLQDMSMLIQLANRLIKQHDDHLRERKELHKKRVIPPPGESEPLTCSTGFFPLVAPRHSLGLGEQGSV